MNDKGNQKHLTFEQRVDIEKGLTENKSFAEIARMIAQTTTANHTGSVGKIIKTAKAISWMIK